MCVCHRGSTAEGQPRVVPTTTPYTHAPSCSQPFTIVDLTPLVRIGASRLRFSLIVRVSVSPPNMPIKLVQGPENPKSYFLWRLMAHRTTFVWRLMNSSVMMMAHRTTFIRSSWKMYPLNLRFVSLAAKQIYRGVAVCVVANVTRSAFHGPH